jgi:hypothetical protein
VTRWRQDQDEVRPLLMAWDPIGVADEPLAAGEYDSLIAPLVSRLRAGTSTGELATWLGDHVESDMGLSRQADRDAVLASQLVAWWRGREPDAR